MTRFWTDEKYQKIYNCRFFIKIKNSANSYDIATGNDDIQYIIRSYDYAIKYEW